MMVLLGERERLMKRLFKAAGERGHSRSLYPTFPRPWNGVDDSRQRSFPEAAGGSLQSASSSTTIRKQHCSRLQTGQKRESRRRFPRGERESRRQFLRIDHRMNLTRQSTSRPPIDAATDAGMRLGAAWSRARPFGFWPFQDSSGECRFNRLGGIHGEKTKVLDDPGAITFSGTFSGALVGARSGAGAGAGVWAGFGTVSGMSMGVEPG